MPVVSVGRDHLFKALGTSYTEDEFQQLCFNYGIELDDVVSPLPNQRSKHPGLQAAGGSDEVVYKIDIPANRYDMLCLEGIARALNIFNDRMATPSFKLADMKGRQMQRVVVRPETSLVRPFLMCAVLRGVKFDAARYNSFIDLQDKLHANLCRQRSLVSIGTHDLGTVQGPFTYEALRPEEINFVPLKQKKTYQSRQLLEHMLEHDQKLKKFVPLIFDSIVYPVVLDANRTVLSLPPIINGAHSAISLDTRDILIEATATDLTKAHVVVSTLCAMFGEYCSTPYEVEPVEVVSPDGQVTVTPRLSSWQLDVPVRQVNGVVGTSLDAATIARLLSKMQLSATASQDGQEVHCNVPVTRSDVLHACDVVEDVAIAYGYNQLQEAVPQTVTSGRELPLNQLVELLRGECAAAGFSEVLTWALCSRHENFEALRRNDDGRTAVCCGNPATAEFEVCRSTLLPGLLKTLGANKDAPLPVKLFEVSDVIFLDSQAESGACNQRRLAAVHSSRESGFEIIHGLLNRVMEVLGVPAADVFALAPSSQATWKGEASSQEADGIRESAASVAACIGKFGVIHPQVLKAFDIPFPVSALEINLEPFCYDQTFQVLPTHLNQM
eukprot:jgi/Astpho2/1424/e_gw1.00025.19.1_t